MVVAPKLKCDHRCWICQEEVHLITVTSPTVEVLYSGTCNETIKEYSNALPARLLLPVFSLSVNFQVFKSLAVVGGWWQETALQHLSIFVLVTLFDLPFLFNTQLYNGESSCAFSNVPF